jgi:riboflavin synthase
MFTGIIEQVAEVVLVQNDAENVHFTIRSTFTHELKIDQSVAHNGVCLTVVKIINDTYIVTAIKETLAKTNLGLLKEGQKVNLERCMQLGARLDGHLVQGHIDKTAKCVSINNENGSWQFTFTYEGEEITVEKGSITINGVSLTVVNAQRNTFSVHIIPYTFEHTTFHLLNVGDWVNIEFDIIGKYVAKLMPSSF